jgi:hypothetical protein
MLSVDISSDDSDGSAVMRAAKHRTEVKKEPAAPQTSQGVRPLTEAEARTKAAAEEKEEQRVRGIVGTATAAEAPHSGVYRGAGV